MRILGGLDRRVRLPHTGLHCVAVGLESPPLSVSEERQLAILTELPFVVPFEERVKVGRLLQESVRYFISFQCEK